MERADNFKKVLNVMFGGVPPKVGPAPGGSSGASTSTGAGSSTEPGSGVTAGSSTGSGASADRWYPDYNASFALGKCSNAAPTPSGRPNYASGEECCQRAYASQASGDCLGALPQVSPESPSDVIGSSVSTSTGSVGSGSTPQTPPPTRQPISPISEAGMVLSSTTFIEMENTLESVKSQIDNKLFLYQTPGFQWVPSSVYRYDDFKASLYIMASEGVAGKKFYIGEKDVDNGHVYGLVNIAAFLAQSMKETIQYDACDENSWDLVGGKYPLSNACGQLSQSYQDYHCSPEEAHMECPVDPKMSIVGVTHAKW